MGGYVEEEEEPERRGLNFFGTDVSKIPCFKHSFMYAIGSGMLTGVAYNLAFSKSPYKLAFGVYTSVLFGYWFVCRYDYRSVSSLYAEIDEREFQDARGGDEEDPARDEELHPDGGHRGGREVGGGGSHQAEDRDQKLQK